MGQVAVEGSTSSRWTRFPEEPLLQERNNKQALLLKKKVFQRLVLSRDSDGPRPQFCPFLREKG